MKYLFNLGEHEFCFKKVLLALFLADKNDADELSCKSSFVVSNSRCVL